jgi:membrane-associated phospholipid phosphatase
MELFQIEKKPLRGLLAAEWVVVVYMVLTTLLMLFTWTKLPDPEPMLWGRFHALASLLALWAVYRMVPCRLTMLCRVALQLAMLSWWYPDTFSLNRIFPNLDHLFANFEQSVFGCQPALLFCQKWTSAVWSELMYLSYFSYFPLIVVVTLYYFLRRYNEFRRMMFVVLGSFFAFYVIFIALPVTGPQYYYLAAGVENIAAGTFPNVGDYFLTHDEMMHMPGYERGLFYLFMEHAHATGERPTAAFPSSHVGVTLVLLLLACRTRCRWLIVLVAILFLLMCMATVYIRAHYAIDVIAGIVVGAVFYVVLQSLSRKVT